MIDVIVHHVDSSVLSHSQEVKYLERDLLALLIILLTDLSGTYMCSKSVLIFVLVIVETLMGNDLCDRKSLVINYLYCDLTGLDIFFDKYPLMI